MKVSLIGFTGAGKSTVAKKLSLQLGLPLVDMDTLIIEKSGKENIAQIFETGGELLFRELEIEVAKELQDRNDVVISTGGGVVINKIIIDYLKTGDGIIVGLITSLEEILKRQPNLEKRALFKDREKVERLYHLRKPLYSEYADFCIETDGKKVSETVHDILRQLRKES